MLIVGCFDLIYIVCLL